MARIEPFVGRSSERERLRIGALDVYILCPSSSSGRAHSLVQIQVPKGGQIPMRRLGKNDCLVYLLGSRFEFICDDRTETLESGSVASIPRQSMHRIRNLGDEAGTVLLFHTPAFDHFYRRASQILESTHDRRTHQINRLLEEFDVEFDLETLDI